MAETETRCAEKRNLLREDFRSMSRHARELLEATKEDSGDRIRSARTRLEDSLRAFEADHRLMGRATELAKSTDTVVREYPYYTMGASFLSGFLAGWITRRR
jgi:ElaB/YqjD/DUF883 family membrane-anchored ribosome-binding protein